MPNWLTWQLQQFGAIGFSDPVRQSLKLTIDNPASRRVSAGDDRWLFATGRLSNGPIALKTAGHRSVNQRLAMCVDS